MLRMPSFARARRAERLVLLAGLEKAWFVFSGPSYDSKVSVARSDARPTSPRTQRTAPAAAAITAEALWRPKLTAADSIAAWYDA